MANVLITYYFDGNSNKPVPLYEAIATAFSFYGNKVLLINIKEFVSKNKYCETLEGFDYNIIFSFSPDIIFTFNNTIPIDLVDMVSCPICVIDADAPDLFWNINYLKNNRNKFLYLGMQKYSRRLYNSILNVELNKDNYSYFPSATSFRSDEIVKDKNIVFIGTSFNYSANNAILSKYDKDIITIIYSFIKEDYFIDFKKIYSSLNIGISEESYHELYNTIRNYYVHFRRIKSLSVLADLGLVLYGSGFDYLGNYYDLDILSCYDSTRIITKDDNQWAYNSSKVAVNISHPQAKSSFSWRVVDIMASNACLLMEDKPDWHHLFGRYISKVVKDSIIYHDDYDMRSKCINLLNDDGLRNKAVNECNYAIEKNGRWIHRLVNIEKLTGVLLVANNKGLCTPYEYIYCNNGLKKTTNSIFKRMKRMIKVRLNIVKNIILIFLLALSMANKTKIEERILLLSRLAKKL